MQSKSIVLIGGGHAHVNVIKTFGTEPTKSILSNKNINVTLIARDIQTPYSGMLPGYVAGHYSLEDIHIDLNQLCKRSNIDIIHASAEKIEYDDDGSGGTIHCSDGKSPIHFDVLSINVGISPYIPPTMKVDYLTPVKPISSFSAKWEGIKSKLNGTIKSYTSENPFILLIVGGGAGGVELVLAAQYSSQK